MKTAHEIVPLVSVESTILQLFDNYFPSSLIALNDALSRSSDFVGRNT